MKKVGYKKGILIGLLICAFGAALFYPAADTRIYALFLLALCIMACGATFLEVAANPYVSILGPASTASSRLNLAQGFNSLGAFVTPFFGAQVILSGVEKSEAELSSMSASSLDAYRIFEADMVKLPYIGLACVFLFIAVVIYFSNLPEIEEPVEEESFERSSDGKTSVLQYKHLVLGVLAIFLYVGAQVGVASFIIRFMQYLQIPGITEKVAASFLGWHLGAFMVGRFVGSAIQQKFDPSKMLAIFAIIAGILTVLAINTDGMVAVWFVVAIGFFNSIMFPTIFTLSIKNLGKFTKDGSTFLVMAIVGAAIIPAIMGYISTVRNIQVAFIVPALCYVYVLFYALKGSKLR
jgi:FHS family L-fucose permease-like MFS transporter